MGDPVTRCAKRRGDFLPGHLASKYVAVLRSGTVAASENRRAVFPVDVVLPSEWLHERQGLTSGSGPLFVLKRRRLLCAHVGLTA